MNAMLDRLAGFLVGISRRERMMIAILACVALPLAVIAGVAQPLAERRAAAHSAADDARKVELWVAEQAVLYANLTRDRATAQSPARITAPVGISGIEASLREAGLRSFASELANAADGGITLRFDAVRFTQLAEWLTAQSDLWGYDLDGFTFERGARADVVEAQLRLVPLE